MFAIPVRIYYEDTDAGGIVYYANYLRFLERARTEFVRNLGYEQSQDLLQQDPFGFAVKHVDIDYKSPAQLDDLLKVTCQAKEISGASMDIFQQIWRGETLLVEANVKVVCLNLNKKRPIRIPQKLLEKLKETL